jgi:hypothetical protein
MKSKEKNGMKNKRTEEKERRKGAHKKRKRERDEIVRKKENE